MPSSQQISVEKETDRQNRKKFYELFLGEAARRAKCRSVKAFILKNMASAEYFTDTFSEEMILRSAWKQDGRLNPALEDLCYEIMGKSEAERVWNRVLKAIKILENSEMADYIFPSRSLSLRGKLLFLFKFVSGMPDFLMGGSWPSVLANHPTDIWGYEDIRKRGVDAFLKDPRELHWTVHLFCFSVIRDFEKRRKRASSK